MTSHNYEEPLPGGGNANRRQFLHNALVMGTGVTMGVSAEAGQHPQEVPLPAWPALPLTNTGPGQIPHKPFGKSGRTVSLLGLGGHTLGDAESAEEAARIVQAAVDAGITFFDNCWEYHNGKSEDWMGRGLAGRRDRVFLMSKVCTHGRSGQLGMQMLEESLRRLQTDYLDLWQIHAVTYDNDPALAYAKGGILEAMSKAKKQGKVRHIGFTGHKDPGIHLEMIKRGFPFDAVQMPLNPCDANFLSFQRQVIPEALKRGIAILGMKAMGGTGDMMKRGIATPEELLRYAMSLPAAVTISGIGSMDHLNKNVAIARDFKPMSPSEMHALELRCAPTSGDGRFELYKVSIKYDNPETRRPHGFPQDPTSKENQESLQGHPVPGQAESLLPR